MKPIRLFLYIAVVSMTIMSCDPCRHIDCITGFNFGFFRIVKASNGDDLVFGPNKIYDKNQIRFYAVTGTDTTYFPSVPILRRGTGYDSLLEVYFHAIPETAYMRLSNGDVDTLKITKYAYDTKCCGRITDITMFTFNDTLNLPANVYGQVIRK